jgi:archaellum component FlaC
MEDWIDSQDPLVLQHEMLVNEIDAIFEAYVQLMGGSTPLIDRISKEDAKASVSASLIALDKKIQDQENAIGGLNRTLENLDTTRKSILSECEILDADCQALYSKIQAEYS